MGSFLSHPVTKKLSEDSGSPETRLQSGASSMQGWRTSMEDAHTALINADGFGCGIFAVFDGHAGHETAQYCAKAVFQELLDTPAFKGGEMQDALETSFMSVDERLHEYGKIAREAADRESDEEDFDEDEEEEGGAVPTPKPVRPRPAPVMDMSGCTAVMCVVREGRIWCANAGDSRAVMCKGGTAVALSTDHKPHLEGELDRIQKAGGFVEAGRVLGRLNVSRSMGDIAFKMKSEIPRKDQMVSAFPEITIQEEAGDVEFLILACDGIWDVLSNQEAVDFVRERIGTATKLSEICEQMMDRCICKDPNADPVGSDNMTAVIVRFNSH